MQKPVLTISEFCDQHHLSRTFYYKLERLGIGPKVMRVGRRTLITLEAAAAWRASMQEREIKEGA